MLSGQATKRDIIPLNLNFAGSLKCNWLSNTLSSFSCPISFVKMLSCSAPGCSNQLDEDPEKCVTFRNKRSEKKWLDQLRRNAHDKKKLVMRISTFVMNTSQRIVMKSVTDTKCWVHGDNPLQWRRR